MAGAVSAGRLWRVWRVSLASELLRRGEDAFLQVVELIVAFFLAAGAGLARFGSGGPGRGQPHQGVPRWGGSWRGACQQLPQMAGLGHAQAGVSRARAQPGPPSFGLLQLTQGAGAEA